jgi:epoxyqueuosine reductase QueG
MSVGCESKTVDSALTGRIKQYAYRSLRVDLVGIANIQRYANAPVRMSPQGILPSAKSVVVMAIHHPDAAIEMGGINHPQEIGPYRVQYWMNSRLDEISYRLGLMLEREGYAAVPIVSSNIWRYKGYKDLTAQFAPDVSHIHSAVAAGLAEHGYNGLAITPEFGARQRYVQVITDAALEPTPLLEPGSVCDNCMLCVEHCLSGALSKEIDGMNVLDIEGKQYTFANKNLWRCAWGEHFDLDLDLPIPEHVDEEVILEQVAEHGFRGGEMGSCLRYCVPPERRYFDAGYTNAPRRKRDATPPETVDRATEDELRALAHDQGVEFVVASSAEELAAEGIDLRRDLPDAVSAMTLGVYYRRPEGPDATAGARQYLVELAAFDVARALERRGYSAMSCTSFPERDFHGKLGGIPEGWAVATATVVSSAPLQSTSRDLPAPGAPATDPEGAAIALKRLLCELGADLVGVAPAERIAALQPQLSALFDGKEHLVARDKAQRMYPYEPEIRVETIQTKTPEDHLQGAKSVIVVGLRFPKASVERTAREPAEAVGPYAFAQYESVNLLSLWCFRAMRWLEDRGYRAALTFDVTGTGSVTRTPPGEQPDVFCNRFAAVAAGLGHIGKGGFVLTEQFGPNVRFAAIVTDAEIAGDEATGDLSVLSSCAGCSRCLQACHTAAHTEDAQVEVAGTVERFHLVDRDRCDWAKRYSLVGEEGTKYVGWEMEVEVPERIDAAALDAALRQTPAIPKHRPCNFEACVLACPLAREQG